MGVTGLGGCRVCEDVQWKTGWRDVSEREHVGLGDLAGDGQGEQRSATGRGLGGGGGM